MEQGFVGGAQEYETLFWSLVGSIKLLVHCE